MSNKKFNQTPGSYSPKNKPEILSMAKKLQNNNTKDVYSVKPLNITWDDVYDSTGYLFSFAKSLACAVKNSPWAEYAEDIIATSGFAFRMWVSPPTFALRQPAIWSFDGQKPWVGVENGGLFCEYVGRYWGQDDIEKQKRLEAIANIKKSIDSGIPAVSWDICVCEWGLIVGYDDETQTFSVLGVSGKGEMPYEQLGKRELPLLSVLIITGKSDKSQDAILYDTKKLAVSHLKGSEWCDNAKGLESYPALIRHFEGGFNPDASWNTEYFLGTFGALKYYAWKYFEKMRQTELAELYKGVYDAWKEAFQTKTG
ncbi:MAG: hypothetical protein LBS36_10740 [Oscillospiraceae bacterium]|jgi:hypothetical protein|nr:hypothetical protein [Oscillospiraceae bacterium]